MHLQYRTLLDDVLDQLTQTAVSGWLDVWNWYFVNTKYVSFYQNANTFLFFVFWRNCAPSDRVRLRFKSESERNGSRREQRPRLQCQTVSILPKLLNICMFSRIVFLYPSPQLSYSDSTDRGTNKYDWMDCDIRAN